MTRAGEKLRYLQSLYDSSVKTNNYLRTQNSKLLEWYRDTSNGSGSFDLCMNALNESVLHRILLNEMESEIDFLKSENDFLKSENDFLKSENDLLDLQVKTLESEKYIRNFLTEASYDKGFLHVSDDRMIFIPFLKKNWNESEKFCRLLNGSLAKVLDEKMNTNMRNILRGLNATGSYWIAGTRGEFEDEWLWVGRNSTREPILWFDWAPGEPNFVDENCIQMLEDEDFKWNNAYCGFVQRFICEKPLF